MTTRNYPVIIVIGFFALSLVLILLLRSSTISLASIKIPEQDYFVVRVYYKNQEILNQIAAQIEPWQVDKNQGYLIIGVDKTNYEWLEQMGLTIEIEQQLTDKVNSLSAISLDQISSIPGFACYKTVEETYAYAQTLANSYPELAEWIDIGDSWVKTQYGNLGYDLYILRITNKNVDLPKPKLFIMSGLHAREFAPIEINTYFANYLLENYGKIADITWLLDYHEIHLLLQANPDGRKQVEPNPNIMWRKNTNENYCSSTSTNRGADLNRNFNFKWHYCFNDNCSSSNQCNETYRGPSAASEPETQAIQNYLRSQFPDQRGPLDTDAAPITATGVFIDLHSYGNLVLWPWGFTNLPTPNSSALQTLGRKFSFFNQYEPGQAGDLLYLTDGDSDGFAYGDLGLAGYTFEIGTNNDWFFAPCSSFINNFIPDNIPALLYAAKVARFPYQLPSGPDTVTISISPSFYKKGEAITVLANINDKRYYGNQEPKQNIAAAELYIDTPPWITTTIPISYTMNAEDGSFDEYIETATVSLETDTLSQGRHMIYIRGKDANGNWGPVTALFLYLYNHQRYFPLIISQ